MKQLFCLLLSIILFGCSLETSPIKSSFRKNNFLKEIIKEKEDYEIQVLLTKINHYNSQVNFQEYKYQLDDNKYFYPASTIKLPIVVLALKKINELRSKGSEITLKSKIILNYKDDYSKLVILDSITSFQNLIADVFLVSDNSASNILIDFIGYNYFNDEMKNAGFYKTYLNHKFNPDPYVNSTWQISDLDNNIISSLNDNQKIIKADDNTSGLDKGERRYLKGEILDESLNFSEKNRSSITDMHNLIKYIFYPDIFDSTNTFNLNVEDYDFLRYWMSRFTYEDIGEKFIGDEKFFETYNKFFIHGDEQSLSNEQIRVYNKIGQAYGTSIDNGLIKNYQDNIEFILTATIYTNKNKVINDNLYEYDDIAVPFLAKLSRAIYDELVD
ncbi:MAG: serine hydrolase [Bacteroidetes bacterium]|nr:serine hydrolase [Cryomorphaceae bacterium]MBL6677648.1 serine hydrolase [Flavobacteriaceae bacterium]MDA0331219.1 serine hydrolase [Bacteroidota bacterium]MDA0885270.1 serine hydrolase [Bacteroidota bacterium]